MDLGQPRLLRSVCFTLVQCFWRLYWISNANSSCARCLTHLSVVNFDMGYYIRFRTQNSRHLPRIQNRCKTTKMYYGVNKRHAGDQMDLDVAIMHTHILSEIWCEDIASIKALPKNDGMFANIKYKPKVKYLTVLNQARWPFLHCVHTESVLRMSINIAH